MFVLSISHWDLDCKALWPRKAAAGAGGGGGGGLLQHLHTAPEKIGKLVSAPATMLQCYISWLINNHCVPSLHCPRPGLLLFISRLMWMCINSGWSRAGAAPTWLQTKLCSCLAILWILDIYHLVDIWCKQWPPQLPRCLGTSVHWFNSDTACNLHSA